MRKIKKLHDGKNLPILIRQRFQKNSVLHAALGRQHFVSGSTAQLKYSVVQKQTPSAPVGITMSGIDVLAKTYKGKSVRIGVKNSKEI